MTKKEAITNLVLCVLGLAGYLINGYAGGIASGFACCLIFLHTIGRRQLHRAGKLIDKRIQDHIKTNNNGKETA